MSSTRPSTFLLNAKFRRFKGVRLRPGGKWVCEIRLPNTRSRIWLGSHSTPEAAARAYDFALVCLRGPDVPLNFPDSPPQVPSYCSLTPKEIQMLAARAAASLPTLYIPAFSPSCESLLREESVSPSSSCETITAPLVETSNHYHIQGQEGQISHIDLRSVIDLVPNSTSKIEDFVSLQPEYNAAKTDASDLWSVLEPWRPLMTDESAWINRPASSDTHFSSSNSSSSMEPTSLLNYPPTIKHDHIFRCACAICCGFNVVPSPGQIGWESMPPTYHEVSPRAKQLVWDI